MPPKKGIVRSGNAGNSSKASKTPPAAPTPENAEKPLFPPGSKYPLSLLHERCQKNGWDKPNVETYRAKGGDGWSFSVTVSRTKASQKESVRLQPHVPHIGPSSLEAKHYGATYALFRFCNNIQLNRVLPPGPREYWQELEAEKKAAPDHQQWMYNPDPFAAKKEVEARQQAVAKQKEKAHVDSRGAGSGSGSGSSSAALDELSSVPEVKMAHTLREHVERVIKNAFAEHPEAGGPALEVDSNQLSQQLRQFGFTPAQIREALEFVSRPSPLSSSLLQNLSQLDACIEFLVLNVPECDLPQRFLPSNNSSRSAISSIHAGSEDIKSRWMVDRMHSAGWPIHSVKTVTSSLPGTLQSVELLVAALDQFLIGENWKSVQDVDLSATPVYDLDTDELEAMGARCDDEDPTHIIMPLFSAPVELHILATGDGPHKQVHQQRPSLYLLSKELPAYVRLHLLSRLLLAIRDPDSFMEPGEGFCIAAMRNLEATWADMEDNGRPDVITVMQHLAPSQSTTESPLAHSQAGVAAPEQQRKRTHRRTQRDDRTDVQVKRDFEDVCRDNKYKELLRVREALPAHGAKEEFLKHLDANRAIVVVGETGCGKTTQLPQYVLDALINDNKGGTASILVTQPRRISAISVAARVSAERLDDGSVGYAIRGESKQTRRTKLLFCTTGVVLRRLSSGDALTDVTHVIVDEVHERSVDSDFLLLELRSLLRKHKTLKIILMSATINHEVFIKYFNHCPLLTIPGRTYPVTDIYLEDVMPLLDYRPATKSLKKKEQESASDFVLELQRKGYDEQCVNAIQSVSSSDQVDYQLISSIVRHIMRTSEKKGGILIFLPGVQEIRQCIESIRSFVTDGKMDVFPLHANLSSEEQKMVFVSTPRWKIVVSTNVAETSITIDDIVYVIDAGKVKESQYESEAELYRLVENWTTKAAARQRRGRAGRTQPGICYKLYTRRREASLGNFPVPEILRVPLENVLLTIKVIREAEDPKIYLAQAIDPPRLSAISSAWSILQELGAIDFEGKLTALGKHISTIPVDLRLGKMLVLATVFRCLGPILTIAALLSSKPLFVSPVEKRDAATSARMKFAAEDSDLLTDLRAYDACAAHVADQQKGKHSLKTFCEQNFISHNTVREISKLRLDFLSALSERGMVPVSATASHPQLNVHSGNMNLLKAVILGGLWPRVARVHLPKSAIKFDQIQAGTIRRENTAKEYKIFDLQEGRVFLHPGSALFHNASWKSPFLVYFNKHKTSKVFLRDATQIPLYALLLLGGRVEVNHVKGGLKVSSFGHFIHLKAWPRIGILVNHLKRLLDAQLQKCIDEGTIADLDQGEGSVLGAMLMLLTHDGLTATL